MHMPIDRCLAGVAALCLAFSEFAAPTLAQSLVQRSFDFGASRSPEYRIGRNRPRGFGFSPRFSRHGNYSHWEEDLNIYRTLCVRLCDGFYFPISARVRRGALYHDNRKCMRRCDGDARLFYYPIDSGSVETMVDLRGRPYAQLPNAFRYRKTLVAGCKCQPAPWSSGAAARHEGYRAQAAQQAAVTPSEEREAESRMRVGESPYDTREADRLRAAPRYSSSHRQAYPRSVPHSRWPRGRNGWRLY